MEILLYLSIVFAIIALTLSIASLVTIFKISKFRRASSRSRLIRLLKKVYGSRVSRRVKRYVLVKVVCFSDVPANVFMETLVKRLYKVLGPALRTRCGLALANYRSDIGKAIVRVSGDPFCVKAVLVALTLMHMVEDTGCVCIPLKTSGLLTRLRKLLR